MKKVKFDINSYMYKLYFKGLDIKSDLSDESGLGTVELVLIMLVMIALVIIFKDQVTAILKNLLKAVESKGSAITN